MDSIAEGFHKFGEDVNADNPEYDISNLLESIIIEAAASSSSKRKTSKASVDKEESLKDRFGMQLLLETECICHYDSCGDSLCVDRSGKKEYVYEVVRIDPAGRDVPGNLIAICPSCAVAHGLTNTDPEAVKRLQEIKTRLVEKNAALTDISTTDVDEGIRNVIRKIGEIEIDSSVPLNYDPVAVRNKIPNDIALNIKVSSYVSAYYERVKEIFKELDKEQQVRYEPFSCSVKLTYLKLKNSGYDQSSIFDYLTEWLMNATNESREYCEIIIAYYVQNCEVYDAVAE